MPDPMSVTQEQVTRADYDAAIVEAVRSANFALAEEIANEERSLRLGLVPDQDVTEAVQRAARHRIQSAPPSQDVVEALLKAANDGYHDRDDYPPFALTSFDDRPRWNDYLRRVAADLPALSRPTPTEGLAGAILRGVGKISGDGWKDTTRKGEVVFVWNVEQPKPHAPGQYPRIGCEGWTASTEQYDFAPVTAADVPAIRAALRTQEAPPIHRCPTSNDPDLEGPRRARPEAVEAAARAIMDGYHRAFPGAGRLALSTGMDLARAAIAALSEQPRTDAAGMRELLQEARNYVESEAEAATDDDGEGMARDLLARIDHALGEGR